jgi:non-homologous end joining protein Ku
MSDSRDLAKIKMPKINSLTGEPVPNDCLCKVFVKDGERIKVPEEALASFTSSKPDSIPFDYFVDAVNIPYFYFDSFYHLHPQKGWEENYALLLQALNYMSVAGITQSVFLNCSSTLALVTYEDIIYLYKLHFNSQLLPVEQYAKPVIDMDSAVFKSLCDFINSKTDFLDLSGYSDSFSDKFNAWLSQPRSG